jgi:hypothetical protein
MALRTVRSHQLPYFASYCLSSSVVKPFVVKNGNPNPPALSYQLPTPHSQSTA